MKMDGITCIAITVLMIKIKFHAWRNICHNWSIANSCI